jgi:hypothetical protein
LEEKEKTMMFSSLRGAVLFCLALPAVAVHAAIHYVDMNSTNPVLPYISWDTAAVTIQDAENASAFGDEILVTNGVYATGETSSSRVSISKAKYVHSVNGPEVTIIQGYQPPGTTNGVGSIRCIIAGASTIAGFTLTNGAATGSGGGLASPAASGPATASNCVFVGNVAATGGAASGAVLVNCRISGNIARDNGGGCYSCRLFNCVLGNNTAGALGGGAYNCGLTNCLLISNSASSGGGAHSSYFLASCTVVSNSAGTGGGLLQPIGPGGGPQIVNSILDSNSATNGPNIFSFGGEAYVLGWCCTPAQSGPTIVTNPPLFVDPANGDFRLMPNSPCINAGRNSYTTNLTDLNGDPRIAGGTVDIGAYEFQNPQSLISYGWLQNHGLPTDGSADYADTDSDGMNNWQEWVTNTDPTNSLSYLRMVAPDGTNNADGVTFHWESVGIRYILQRSTNLAGPFTTFATNFFAGVGIATYRDATATNAGPYFYRVGVQP